MPPTAKTSASGDAMLVGMDLGTSSTAVVFDGGSLYLPTALSRPKPGVLPGLLPNGGATLYGKEALSHHNLVDVVWPIRQGTVAEPQAASEFSAHVASLVDPERKKSLHVVVGTPAHAPAGHMSAVRQALGGSFHKVQLYPEPFLVVMGLRQNGNAGNGESDPALNSMVIDIGAGTTDVTIVQGMLPGLDHQLSVPIAGDSVDQRLWDYMVHLYPDLSMPRTRVTALKEEHSYLGEMKSITASYPVLGEIQPLEIGEAVRIACQTLIDPCVSMAAALLRKSPPEMVEGLQQNIILAGGGSRIENLDAVIQEKLKQKGFTATVVRKVKNYRHLVGEGALAIAKQSHATDWQNLTVVSKG